MFKKHTVVPGNKMAFVLTSSHYQWSIKGKL